MTLASSRRVALAGLVAGACALVPLNALAAPASTSLSLTRLGTYATGAWDESASEIVAFDKHAQRLFVVNAQAGTVDVLDASDPTALTKVASLDTPGANSVAVSHGLVAVAEQAADKTDAGTVSFFDARSLARLNTVTVGALPDMVTFTPDGKTVLVANEGEPYGYLPGQVDPEGSVSVIDVRRGAERATVRTAGFGAFDAETLKAKGVRLNGPHATVAQDLEPEYITVDQSGHTAWVTLQEANAIAIVDVTSATVTDVVALGLKDHSLPGNGLDASDKDKKISIANWPVKGLYMPDGIASFRAQGRTFTITANEGDSRADWDGIDEEVRVKKLDLDPTVFPNAEELQKDANLGRLNVVTDAPTNAKGEYNELWSYGARSVSIWDAAGRQVWDSGDQLEQALASFDPASFNGEGQEDGSFSFDDRSDNKGPEPEGVATGKIGGRTYAFVGLERASAIVAYDVTRPSSPVLAGVFRNPGDVAPEGLLFIPASDSPTHAPLLVVGNEVSGTTTVWQIGA